MFDLFLRMKMIERVGTGIPRMKEASLPEPRFELQEQFTVTFYFDNTKDSGIKFGNKVRERKKQSSMESKKLALEKQGMKRTVLQVFEMVFFDKDITIPKMAENLDLSTRTVEKHLKTLKEHKVIKRLGNNKSGYWEVL